MSEPLPVMCPTSLLAASARPSRAVEGGPIRTGAGARRSRSSAILVGALALLLAACGGGGGGGSAGAGSSATTCTVAEETGWLGDFFARTYFWNPLSPRPDASGFASANDYFKALLYAGGDPIPGTSGQRWPRDRWSGSQSTERFNQFYGEGQSMGYGVAVAGLEVKGQPAQPLYVRYVDPLSPAALADVRRGDRVLAIGERSAADVIQADDFSALSATATGQTLTLRLQRGTAERMATLVSAVYPNTPVPEPMQRLVTTPAGRRVGYLHLQSFVAQGADPLRTRFAEFRAQGVEQVVLDLRYNGGGLVSAATLVGSHFGGPRVAGQVFATLLYGPSQASRNTVYRFDSPAPAASLSSPRVYALVGRRTCSASEMLINGLRGVGVEVVAIGEATCGKPVGFVPESSCGTTWSIVNFESVNALGQGRYFDGLAVTCPVAEDFTRPMGAAGDPLLASALHHADTGVCLQPTARAVPLYRRSASDAPEPGERRDLMP